MDITYKTNTEKFKYRVSAVILSDGKLLTVYNEQGNYYYLLGGKVQFGEAAETAIVREMQEELGVTPKIVRPLWLNQSFFTETVNQFRYHELSIYFLLDVSDTDLPTRGETFTVQEGQKTHRLEWLSYDRLQNVTLHPAFLKQDAYNLPETFTLRTEVE